MACNPLTFLALLYAFYAPQSFAAYVQASPPPGWSAGGGSGGSFTGTKAANGATFLGSTVSTNASLNVGARSVSLPASMRFAANAPRIAATAIMLNPYLRTAATVAGWLGLASLVYDEVSGLWQVPLEPAASQEYLSDGYQYRSYTSPYGPWRATKSEACRDYSIANGGSPAGMRDGYCLTKYSNGYVASNSGTQQGSSNGCPSGWYVTPAGCLQTPPPKSVTQEQAVEELTKHPMPSDLPRHIPVPLPVEQPAIQPVFIPSGDPITNPKFNPSEAPSPSNPPMVQPGVDVKPAPAPGTPWQVDVTPVNRPITDPTATPDREPVPIPDPGGSGNPPTDNKPQETPGLCDLYPNIVACMDAGQADTPPELPTKEIDFNFQVEGGFFGSRACPAPKEFSRGIVLDYSGLCNVLDIARNVLLAFAWISAALIVLRGRAD